jgi:hypothetical protein
VLNPATPPEVVDATALVVDEVLLVATLPAEVVAEAAAEATTARSPGPNPSLLAGISSTRSLACLMNNDRKCVKCAPTDTNC